MRTPHIALLALSAAAALAVLGAAGPSAAAPQLNTYVTTVGGQAVLIPPFGCSTGGAPAAAGNFFANAGVGGGSGVPSDGLATCGVGGGFNAKTGTVAPLSDSMSLATTFNAGANSFNGSVASTARYGKVGAEAHATTTGPVNSFIYYGAESQAIFREPLTLSPPGVAVGTPGQVRFKFHIDGSISAVGPGTSLLDFVYEKDAGPNFILMRASLDPRLGPPFITASVPGPGIAGFAATDVPGVSQSLTGEGDFFTFMLDILYGVPFDFSFGVRAWASPAIGTNDIAFHNSALMTGIEAFVGGVPLSDFLVTSGSGTFYDKDGVHLAQDPGGTVPEPATLALLVGGLAGIGFARRHTA